MCAAPVANAPASAPHAWSECAVSGPRGLAGIKTYCLQYLAMHPSSTLRVPCPICRTDYRIVSKPAASASSIRELLRFTSTDRELLLRHCRYFLLVLPLLASTFLAWRWMYECVRMLKLRLL